MLFEILKGLADRFGTFRMPETSWGAGASRSQPLKLPGPGEHHIAQDQGTHQARRADRRHGDTCIKPASDEGL